MTEIIETSRMRLREFTPDDLDVLAEMVADEDQMRFSPVQGPETKRKRGSTAISRSTKNVVTGSGSWNQPGDLLGYCGLRPLTIEGVEETRDGHLTSGRDD